jgi:S1-C subfamily serine protease
MTRTGSYEGYSFAIPSNIVKKVVKDLKEFGMVQRAFIGIVPSEVSPILAQKLGLKNNGGVHISKIQHGGAAEDAGLKEGDVILSLDKISVKTMVEYQQQLATYRPGATIDITFWRNNKTAKVALKLRNQSNTTGVIDKQALDMLNQLGLQTRDMTTAEQSNLQAQGVMVVNIRPGSKIALTNMEQDFIITKINGKNIKNQAAFVAALTALSNKILLEGFYPSVKGMYAYTFIK